MMYKRMLTGLLMVVLIGAFASTARVQADAGCTTAKCHADMGTKEWVHGPVGAGICTVCHNTIEGKEHEFVLAAEKEELCFGCHEAKRDLMLSDHVHTPVADGNCTGCHDPHQSDFRFTLKGKAADLCYNCHDRTQFEQEFVHGPVGAGDCNACHDPHGSANEEQLMAPRADLCYVCHQDKQDEMNKRHVHQPVAENCTNCHSPHSNAAAFMLPASPPDLCFDCHTNLAGIPDAPVPHPPAASGECGSCHEFHSSDYPRLFDMPQEELCFSCHSEMEEFVTSKTYRHGPVLQGDCNACHNPHGSENHRILRKNFPEEFYKPYDEDNYALCFECHNREIARDERTETLTDFRDKDRNLHFLHVNKQEKGRSCRACHQVHASNQEKHIRKSVPFGGMNWELPVTFTKNANGGRCVVGCHAPKDYSRK